VSRASRQVLWNGAAALAVLAFGMAALILWWPRGPREVLPENVPPSWTEYRTSPGHQSHVGRQRIECHACHEIERDGFKNPGTAVCGTCHAKEAARMHRGGAGAQATSCLSCHTFAPDAPAPTCIGCHVTPRGLLAAVVQHATTDCAKCHRVHESPPIVPAGCTSCHEERAARHAAHEGSAGCADCHRDHAPAAAALAMCSFCHSAPAGPRPAGHDSCIGCHRPHDFVAGGERACIGCHGEKATLVAAQVPAHAVCTSCHTPHAPADAASSCVRCHATVQVAHGGGGCVDCHVPHAQEPRPVAIECTSCHARVAAFETGAHAGGIVCQACHKPHGFAGVDPKTLCNSCHSREISLVASNVGHRNCGECHGAMLAHAPAAAPACGTCHAKEQATAPTGHLQCQACHDPHAGQPTPACASCHQDKANGPHQAVAGGCETCHRPHGPAGIAASPSCAACHARSTLPALHAATGHSDCAACHVSSHAAPHDDRATCMASNCHADRRNHQPQAQVCTGCHVFRR
jgi:hypothetical protein